MRRGVLVSGACVLLAGLLMISARPTYRGFKEWRARNLAAKSETFLAQGQFPEAMRAARAAYLMRSYEPSAIRAVARVQNAGRQPQAMQFWQALIATGSATPEDRREYVELCIRIGALPQAQSELRRLVVEAPAHPANLWLLSQLSLARGEIDQAIEFSGQARASDPAHAQYRLFHSSIQYDAADGAVRSRARQEVWEVAEGNEAPGLEALVFLAGRRELTGEQLERLIRGLIGHPLSLVQHHLLGLDLRIRLHPERKDALIQAAIAEYQEGAAPDLNLLCAWLNRRSEFEYALKAMPLEQALRQRESFILHMDALAGIGRWQEVQKVLSSVAVPLPGVFIEAFGARAALQLNDPDSANAHWRRAQQAAEGDADELAFLADYSLKAGQIEPARRAYRSLAAVTQNPFPVYLAWSRLLQSHGTTEELRNVLAEIVGRWPGEVSLQNDLAYLNLLLEQQIPAARRTAEQLVRLAPGSLPIRSTLALGYLRESQIAAALEVLEAPGYDWRQALPGNRAVFVAVLAANGRNAEAREQLRDLPRHVLRQEELALLPASMR